MHFDEAVKKAISMEGKGILANSRKLGAFLADLSSDDTKMINVICHMSSDHIFDRLASCPSDQNEHQIDMAVSQMQEYYSQTVAEKVEKALRKALLPDNQQAASKPEKKPEPQKVDRVEKEPDTVSDAVPVDLTNLDPGKSFSEEEFNKIVKPAIAALPSDPSSRLVISYRSPHPYASISSIEISPENNDRKSQYYHVSVNYIKDDRSTRLEKSVSYIGLIRFLYTVMVKLGNADYFLTDQEKISGTDKKAGNAQDIVLGKIRTSKGISVFMLDLTLNKYDLIYFAVLMIYLLLWLIVFDIVFDGDEINIQMFVINLLLPALTFLKFKVTDNWLQGNHSIWWHVVSIVIYVLTGLYAIEYIGCLAAVRVIDQITGSGLLSMIASLLFITFIFWIQMKHREEEPAMLITLYILSGIMLVFLLIGGLFSLII